MQCKTCNKPLSYNEEGLNKKLLGRAVTQFYCKTCLAKVLQVSIEKIEEKEKQFIEDGCTLFVKEKQNATEERR